MNLKDTINFTKLRERGPSGVDVKDDEVIQLVTRDSEIKVIITQEYFLNLLSAYNYSLVRTGHKKQELVNIEEKLEGFQKELDELLQLSREDKKEEVECKTGHRKVGNF